MRNKINFLVGPQERLLTTVKRWKLAWLGHLTSHDSLSKTILQGTLEGVDDAVVGRRNAGRTTSKSWTYLPMLELLTRASCRKDWKRISVESSLVFPNDPIGQRTELN
ncbi:MAG TPA: hypothetical protein EYO59_10465 [Chromatiaceae bacterium]|nr:hypothetical protein [Chromatiaceae bacterium]